MPNFVPEEAIKHLYKFRSLALESREFTERILTENELYFSRPSAFNDPFDCLPVMSLEAPDPEFLKYLIALYKRRMPGMSRTERKANAKIVLKDRKRNHRSSDALATLQEGMQEATNSAGVLSLAEHPDHVLMWAHYADSHRGICLRFRASSTTPFFGYAQRVHYQVERPAVNLINDSPHVQSEKALLTKADFWSYEREWRIVEHEKGPGVQRFPPELLDGLVLGARILKEDKERMLALAKDRSEPLQVFEARISATKFAVEIHEI